MSPEFFVGKIHFDKPIQFNIKTNKKAIEALRENRTALIITQRASTCESADLVVVMDKGRIVAQGKHRELLLLSNEYRQLIESQVLELGGDD